MMNINNKKIPLIVPILIFIAFISGCVLPFLFSSLGIAGVILFTIPISYILVTILFFIQGYKTAENKYNFIYYLLLCITSLSIAGFSIEFCFGSTFESYLIEFIFSPYIYMNMVFYTIGYLIVYIKSKIQE